MKLTLIILAAFGLAIAALHAQTPAVPANPDAAALTSVLPVSWQGWATIALVLVPLLGRGWHAWTTNGGAKVIWNAIVFGTNTPSKLPLVLGVLCLLLIPSCQSLKTFGAMVKTFNSTPQGQAVDLSIEKLGMAVALEKGLVTPGQQVTILHTLAIVTDPNDSTVNKVLKLADVGLADEVAAGKLTPGDSLLIKTALTAVHTAVVDETTAAKNPPPDPVAP